MGNYCFANKLIMKKEIAAPGNPDLDKRRRVGKVKKRLLGEAKMDGTVHFRARRYQR